MQNKSNLEHTIKEKPWNCIETRSRAIRVEQGRAEQHGAKQYGIE